MEIRYKNILTEVSEQSIKCDSLIHANCELETHNRKLEENIQKLVEEKRDQTEILAELQQNLIQRGSDYENQIRNMQIELGNRLDEINVVKKEDVNKVKGHYMELFQEKASEVMILRDEAERLNQIIEGYKSKVKDFEYREEELNNLVNKMREGKMSTSSENEDVYEKLKESKELSKKLNERVETIHHKFEEVKEESKVKLETVEIEVNTLQNLIREKDIEIDCLRQNLSCKPKYPENSQINDNQFSQHSSQRSHAFHSDSNHNLSIKPKSRNKKKRKSKAIS